MVDEKLKTRLIDQIKKIDNPEIIEDIYRLLEIDLDESIYITNTDQKQSLHEALEQYNSGEILTNEEAKEQTDQWLKRRK